MVGQSDGPAAREAQLPAKPMLTSLSGPVRVSRASVRRVAVDEGDAVGPVRGGRPVRHERPAVLDQLALDGESSDIWKPAP